MQTIRWSPLRSWVMASALLAAGTVLSAVVEAAALDLWIHRPAAASVTTLVPGMAYASATVMKVCLVGALLAGVIACAMRLRQAYRMSAAAPAAECSPGSTATSAAGASSRNSALASVPASVPDVIPGSIPGSAPGSAMHSAVAPVFVSGASSAPDASGAHTRLAAWSLASIALAPLSLLAGTIAVLAAQALLPAAPTLADFPRISRIGVLAMMTVLAAGVASAIAALRAAERPRSLALAASMLSLLLLGLFWHLQFFVLHFDQDTWAR